MDIARTNREDIENTSANNYIKWNNEKLMAYVNHIEEDAFGSLQDIMGKLDSGDDDDNDNDDGDGDDDDDDDDDDRSGSYDDDDDDDDEVSSDADDDGDVDDDDDDGDDGDDDGDDGDDDDEDDILNSEITELELRNAIKQLKNNKAPDDTVILSETPEGMQNALDIFQQYCDTWKLQIG
ncbi:calsequestrin-1-like [Argopecten irradians]|uniref:calsequestrin-1-like n=1 Tax=Argopecten irradians TaxID=31199 RepID=UPI00371BEF6B